MTEDLLDNPDATHTKSIENYFGQVDGLLKTATPKGFLKSVDDLIIKHNYDLLVGQPGKWYTREIKDKARQLKEMEKGFAQHQADIQKTKNENNNAAIQQNKILKVVTEIKRSHNGPITTVSELKTLVDKYKNEYKTLYKILALEIRFRKISLTKIKGDYPLFKQEIPRDLKIRNLESLITSSLTCSATADIDDLREAINNNDSSLRDEIVINSKNVDQPPNKRRKSIKNKNAGVTDATSEVDGNSGNNFKVGEFVVGLFEDNLYVGEIKKIEMDLATITFMTRLQKNCDELWLFPSHEDTQILKESNILQVYPQMDLDLVHSNNRLIIMKLLNYTIFQNIARTQ